RFLPETGKPLLSSYLRKLGAVFAVILNGAKNLSEAMHEHRQSSPSIFARQLCLPSAKLYYSQF
ncbi:6115_t:CDS:1, partial [Rhizophagus irregularis]